MTRRLSLALAALAVPLLLAGLAATYVKLELADPEPFADRAVAALRSSEVRQAIAEQVAVEMVERGSPDLVASRPLVLTGVEAVLETDEFARVLRRAAIAAHALLLNGDRDVIVELEEGTELLIPAVRSVSPEVAGQIPTDLNPRIAAVRGSDAATSLVRLADAADAAAVPLVFAAVALLALSVALAPDRRRAAASAGLMVAAGTALALVATTALRAQVLSHAQGVGALSDEEARSAAGATWDALAGDLETWFAVVGVGGLAISVSALLVEARFDRHAALRNAVDLVAGGRLPRSLRVLRGLGLAAIGALILLEADPVFTLAAVALGGMLVLLGLSETLSVTSAAAARPRVDRRRRRVLVTGGALALGALAAATALILIGRGGPPAPPAAGEIRACNGAAVLCDRRLDQVVLPGTHNSMSAADRPGWYFANQIRPIPSQLRDGIRLLMIDPHYGVEDSEGRVRTDLRAEGTNRNRVGGRLGAQAVEVAERLAGRLGLVPAEGERAIYLCHTLCELGAERMASTLDEIRGFLERNPSEVLIVILESSVDPAEVEREFEEADLEPYLAVLDRGRPLPTLRRMIASGRRLVVFDEGDGGAAEWYQPEFLFVKDTPIRSVLRSPGSCEPGRGEPESPLLLMNHWVDRFPPSPSANRRISDRESLLTRVRSCRRRRGAMPNLIAVDFYGSGAVLPVARELNMTPGG